MARTAVVAGGTGLIGRLLVQDLLDSREYSRVIVLARRALPQASPKLTTLVTAFDDLDRLVPKLGADDAYCCLGTTQGKAGRAGLERVDHGMVLDFARAVHAAGVRRFVVVSAIGASPHSPSFYSRVKARMERDVAAVGFEAVHIVRPSLLLGARAERRPAERLAQKLSPLLSPLFVGRLRKYRPIAAADVAAALRQLALQGASGVHIHDLPL